MRKALAGSMVAVTLAVFGLGGSALAAGGPRSAELTAPTCGEARAKAEKKATEVCAKAGGLAWTEYSADCEDDTQLMPGVPVTLQVHFLCGADL